MKNPAVFLAAVLLLAPIPAFAQHGGGHAGGGHSSGHSGSARSVAPLGDFHASGRRTLSGAPVGHLPGDGAPVVLPGRVVIRHGKQGAPLNTGHVRFAPPPHAVVRPGIPVRARRPVFPRVFFGGQPVFFLPPGAILLGNNLFCDPFTAELFFFDPFFLEQFGPNVFCPFCAFGRVNPFFPPGFGATFITPFGSNVFFSRFGRRRFFGRVFFDGFGFDPFVGLNADPTRAVEQEQAGETPAEPGELPPGETFEASPATPGAGAAHAANAPLTLLVFKDGSIYAVTDYWLKDGWLHYRTSYGGENTVPLDRLDLDTTAQMNWERGNPFTLRPGPAK